MKKLSFISITAIILFTFAVNLFAEVSTLKVKTTAVCGECVKRITAATTDLSGVLESNVDLKTQTATIMYDAAKTNPTKIRKAISLAGYQADDMAADANAFKKLPAHCQSGIKDACKDPKCIDKGCATDKTKCSDKCMDKPKTDAGACCPSSKTKTETKGCCPSEKAKACTGTETK